ncbi:NADPH-Fe(3+) oxidoreductase subunit alpha [Moorella thermoacetica]|uniref:Ferredoxin n=1 Tax=Neomoorella thermoacetica TaxID=1525 RepID=A0A1J5JF24_NEOTH|nr:2Fe-2S iron-sulfur cluster-binding protein [Moorella thermoacetica]OIQ07789.1 NADPH-Fe(3+) oxidoreductase subunit alpha [Moorella thermoacetica]
MPGVSLTINDKKVRVPAGTTILEAARELNITIPTLCHDKRLSPFGACRLCVVEVRGRKNLPAACVTPVEEDMTVLTESPAVVEARRTIIELLLANHPLDCLTCEKSGNCRLQDYAYRYGVKRTPFEGTRDQLPLDDNNPFIIRDPNKCILCGKCVRACQEIRGQAVLGFAFRGPATRVVPPLDVSLGESDCVFCQNCVAVCPTGALRDKYLAGKGRWWEFQPEAVTCPFCANGCHFYLLRKEGKVVAVAAGGAAPGRPMCLRGRLALTLIFCEEPPQPQIKTEKGFAAVSWTEALGLEELAGKLWPK